MKKAIPALILGLIAAGIGWMGYGGFIFGIPALILGVLTVYRETGAPTWIGALGIIFAGVGIVSSIGAAVFIAEVEEAAKPGKLSSVTVKAMDHDKVTSMKVHLEGEKDSYSLTLSDPIGNTIGTGYVSSSDMADGRETVWVSMANYGTAAKAGTYTLIIEGMLGGKAFENTFTYSGANLTVESWGSPKYTELQFGTRDIESLDLTVKNNGDLPAYISGSRVKVNEKESDACFSEPTMAIAAGETVTLTADFFFFGPFEPGTYSATYELLIGLTGEEEVLESHSTTIQVPE